MFQYLTFSRWLSKYFCALRGLWLQTERVHSQAEERKREKENVRVRRDKLQALRDIEARAEAENLSSDTKPTAAELAEAQSLREEVLLLSCCCSSCMYSSPLRSVNDVFLSVLRWF